MKQFILYMLGNHPYLSIICIGLVLYFMKYAFRLGVQVAFEIEEAKYRKEAAKDIAKQEEENLKYYLGGHRGFMPNKRPMKQSKQTESAFSDKNFIEVDHKVVE